jgi:hypothetical protein
MANFTQEQIDALNAWTRTQPSLSAAFDYTRSQGVPGSAPPSDGLGDRLTSPEPGSAEEVATLQSEVDFESSDTIIYQGFAEPGVATSAALWRIKRIVFTADAPNSDDVSTTFASDDSDFIHVWDDRLTLSY